jgi:predicted Zn-dependent protease
LKPPGLINVAPDLFIDTTPIQITAALLNAMTEDAKGVGLSGLVGLARRNLIHGFGAGLLTDELLLNTGAQGLIASLIANGHQDWINAQLAESGDRNLMALHQYPNPAEEGQEPLSVSQLSIAALNGSAGFQIMYDQIRGPDTYALSAAAFEAYAVTVDGRRYLLWLARNDPGALRATLKGVIPSGFLATFHDSDGYRFWNELAVINPSFLQDVGGNRWAGFFRGWSANDLQAMAYYTQNQAMDRQSFIGAARSDVFTVALGEQLVAAMRMDPRTLDVYANSASGLLDAFIENRIDIASGTTLPFAALSSQGIANILHNAPQFLRSATPAQIAAIDSGALIDAMRSLPWDFWHEINPGLLAYLVDIPYLRDHFFAAPGGEGQINQDFFDSIPQLGRDVIASALADMHQQGNGLAGNRLLIDQQLTSGISLLASQAGSVGNVVLANLAQGALQQIQELIVTGYQGEVATGAIWAKESVITVSAVGWNDAQMTQLSNVLDQYAAITGLTFVMVASGGQIDLELANLDTAHTGSVGFCTWQAVNGEMRWAQVLIENPEEDPIDGAGNFTGTQASFTQVLTHELGHALGLADNNLTNSLMNYYLDSQNQYLSTSDISALHSLYSDASNGSNADDPNQALSLPISLSQLDQLTQAMASTTANAAMSTLSIDLPVSLPNPPKSFTLVMTPAQV